MRKEEGGEEGVSAAHTGKRTERCIITAIRGNDAQEQNEKMKKEGENGVRKGREQRTKRGVKMGGKDL